MRNSPIDNVYVVFGRRVRDRRQSLKWTQQELSEKSGINRVSLAKLERGKQRILFHDAISLAGILGIAIDEMRTELSSAIIAQKYQEQPKQIQKQLSKLGIFGEKK